MNKLSEAQRQSALNQQQAKINMPVANWTPIKPHDIRMAENLKRCEEYRAIKSLDMDNA